MALTAEDLQSLSRLLDEALDLSPELHSAWLENLPPEHRHLAPALMKMIARQHSDTAKILPGLPRYDPSTLDDTTGLAAESIVGPYRLIRELGRGGMGSVWLAERTDGSLKRQIALKLPHSSLPQRQLAERFARERDILAALNHPHIARLYDAGVTDEGRPYLALEYVDGQPLNTYCDALRLGIKARLELFQQVLSALQYAHNQLVVHRDLKPSNILVTAEGEVKLLDFGIAKLLTDGAAHETELTQLGGRALTPQYASPEQILGQPIGTASDVYALGVVLYELLTGSLPYRLKRDSRGALEDAILSADAARPSKTEVVLGNAQARDSTVRKLVALLKGDLDTIVLKALKKNAAERYATAQLFADDLRRYLGGEAVLAQPDSTWYRTSKFIRRNWLGVGAASAVVVALAVGLGIALWQAQAARISEAHARTEAQTARAVQSFLVDIFQSNSSNQSDPQSARNTTARELLDRGVMKIDTALADAPPAKLEILKTLGQLYIEIGLNKESAALQRKRVELARAIFGAQSGETVDALLDLAQVLSKQLDDPDWEKSLKEAQSILDSQDDTTSLRRARLNARLATYYREHELDKAADFSERALAIYRKFPPDREFVLALMAAADANANRDKYTTARSTLREAVAAIHGTTNVASADLLPHIYSTLAETEYWLEAYAEAETYSRLAWEQAKSLNGDLDVITLGYLMDYSTILISNGRVGEGITKMQQAVKAFRSAKGWDEPARLSDFLSAYANALKYYGRIEAAIGAMREARQVVAQAGDTLRQARLMGEEANILVMLGHVDEASKFLDDAKGMLDRSQSSSIDWAPYDNRTRLEILLAQHRLKEANLLAKDVFAKLATSTSRARMDLIARERLALANGDPKAALALALKSIAEIEGGSNQEYLAYHRYSSYQAAGQAFLMLHQAGEAAAKLRTALQLAGSLFDPRQSPKLAETEIALAQCLLDLQKVAEAKALAASARVIHSAHKELGEQYRQPLRELERRLATIP